MHKLERITIHNWNVIEAQDIEVRGNVALTGPTGIGKSTILDAIQTVVTGNNLRALELNASSGKKQGRSVLDYCIGRDDQVAEEPLRPRCDSVLALSFRDTKTGTALCFGLLLSADKSGRREDTRARFKITGHGFKIADFIERDGDGDEVVLNNEAILARLKAKHPGQIELYQTSKRFVDDYLATMRRRAAAPNAEQFLRNFSNAIAFEEIDNPTKFVRQFVLPPSNLQLERVRDQIRNWRDMETTLKDLEQRLDDIQLVRSRFQNWGRHYIALNTAGYVASHAERLRLELEAERLRREIAENAEKLAAEESAKDRQTNAITALEADKERKQALVSASSEAATLHALNTEEKAVSATRRQILKMVKDMAALYAGVANLSSLKDRIPISLHAAVDAAASLRAMTGMVQPEALIASADALAALETKIRAITGAADSLATQHNALSADVGDAAKQVEELEAQLAGAEADGAALSLPVRTLKSELARLGIEATPLPDVVEITEPDWAYALEALLGPNREALIVRPAQVKEAFDYLYKNRQRLRECRLVNTNKTARGRGGIPAGSIAEIIETNNLDARVFIESHVGRYVRAEDERDLHELPNAILRNGKTSSGMSLRVFGDLRPILGKTAMAGAIEGLRSDLADARDKHATLMRVLASVNSAILLITRLKQVLEDPETKALRDLLNEVAVADDTLARISSDRANLGSAETRALVSEIKAIEADITRYRAEIRDEIEPTIRTLSTKEAKLKFEHSHHLAEAAKCRAAEQTHEAAEARTTHQSIIAAVGNAETIAEARAEIAAALDSTHRDDPRAYLAEQRNTAAEAEKKTARACEESGRRALSEFIRFVQRWCGQENPVPGDSGEAEKLVWAVREEKRLDEHELRPHRDAVVQAKSAVETALQEDLLTKLNEKFETVTDQIKALNTALRKRVFTGQTYSFTKTIDPKLKSLHDLAEAVAKNAEKGLAVIGEEHGQTFKDAMAKMDEILKSENDTKELEDYRNYFTFELHMENERGVKTNLSTRSASGSGGQKQTPYYIAIAASMAAVYYPGSVADEDPDGMGLVVFDEAFSNIDVANTQALLNFFRDLHLQVIVAAPEQKRADFIELMDTIVPINRSPDLRHMYIDPEYPGQRARDELAKINPARRGIAGFREQTAAAAE